MSNVCWFCFLVGKLYHYLLKYSTKIKNITYPDYADMVLVVVALSNSLTFLFGINFNTALNKSPELPDMAKKRGLKKKRPDLFRELKNLFEFYRNISRWDFQMHPILFDIHYLA